MNLDRRFLLGGGAAAAAAAVSPDRLWARGAAAALPADWSLAVADLDADLPERAMRRISGRAPAGLAGTLYRNGPGKFRRGASEPAHWFDGDGLVRAFRIGEGGATLRARFVDTPKRRADAAAGALVTPGFGTRGSAEARVGRADDLNAANTSLLALEGKLWALWEAGSATAIDPRTLATQGVVDLRDDLRGMPFLAHPKVEPDGRVWNLGVAGERAMVWRLSASGALEDATLIALPRASYIHDFTATDRELVIVLQPWVRERFAVPIINGMAWRPELGTRVLVIDKADLTRRRTFELPPFFFFHLGDAWRERDGTIRFDGCIAQNADFATRDVARMTHGVSFRATPPVAALFALHPDGRAGLERTRVIAEFPRSDPRRAGLPRRYTWHVTGAGGGHPLARGLACTDWRSGKTQSFDFGAGHVVDEAVFVPRPGSSEEGDGWLVGPSINLAARASELHVFDARRVALGPLCSWRADAVLPAGFHGAFVPA